MYFQGRRNTCNMLRSLKQKAEKRVDELPQNISSKMFCWSSISKRNEIMPSFRQMHQIKEIRVDMLPYLYNTSVVSS